MANNMKEHLPTIEVGKMEKLFKIQELYESGKLTLEEARKELAEKVGKLRPYHMAYVEQTMKDFSEDECTRTDLRKTLALMDGLLDSDKPKLPTDHPLTHYYKENDEMRKLLLAVEDLVQYPMIKNQWLELYDQIKLYPIHYSRKQNQLYPILEKKGFDRPTTTMWNFDDIIKDAIRTSQALLADDKEEEFIKKQEELIALCRDLMDKEETILYPTALALITPEEFEDMKSGDQEIGFAFINVAHEEARNASAVPPQNDNFAKDLQALLSKYGYSTGEKQLLDVTTGELTLEQINLIYQHLPVDISYVDENELVKFYSDTDHRIFPRSKNVIGRQVINCHPRKSLHIVQEIIEKFRSGEQQKAEFWINKPGVFIHITYIAVHDKEGNFRGVLEMMQDCTHIRELQGSRTLLTWAEGKDSITEVVPPETDEADMEDSDTVNVKDIEITEHTRLKDLFATYPNLKKNLAAAVPKFKMLNSPLGKIMLRKATVGLAAEYSGLGKDRLIETIKENLS